MSTKKLITKNQNLLNFKVFDQKNINNFRKEDQKEFLEDFIRIVAERIDKIHENDNIKDVILVLHSISGFASGVGAEQICEQSKEIESLLKDGKFPEDKNWWQDLKDNYLEFKNEAEIYIKSLFD